MIPTSFNDDDLFDQERNDIPLIVALVAVVFVLCILGVLTS